MDNFISKFSQKLNTQDTIKANFMADMAEKEQLKKQLEEYDSIMQSVRDLYAKQEENSTVFQEMLAKLDGVSLPEQQTDVVAELKDMVSKSDEFTHKECVKVYRNVQALLDEQNQRLDEMERCVERGVSSLSAQIGAAKVPDLSGALAYFERLEEKHNKSNKILLFAACGLSLLNIILMLCISFGLIIV